MRWSIFDLAVKNCHPFPREERAGVALAAGGDVGVSDDVADVVAAHDSGAEFGKVVPYEDFVRLGGEAACRDAGLLREEGRDYEMKDGDMVEFLFNV